MRIVHLYRGGRGIERVKQLKMFKNRVFFFQCLTKGEEPFILVGDEGVTTFCFEEPSAQPEFEPNYKFNFWEFPMEGGNAQKRMTVDHYKCQPCMELKMIKFNDMDIDIYYVLKSVYTM